MVVRSQKELLERLENGWNLVRKRDRWYVQRRLPGNKYQTEIVDKGLNNFCQKIRNDSKSVEEAGEKAEEKIAKKVQESVVKEAVRQIDMRTKYIMKWGTWVENNILPLSPGETWEEKANFVIDMLEELKQAYPKYASFEEKVLTLEKENIFLKDIIKALQKQVDVYKALEKALLEAIRSNADSETIDKILQRLLELNPKLNALNLLQVS